MPYERDIAGSIVSSVGLCQATLPRPATRRKLPAAAQPPHWDGMAHNRVAASGAV